MQTDASVQPDPCVLPFRAETEEDTQSSPRSHLLVHSSKAGEDPVQISYVGGRDPILAPSLLPAG